MTKTIRIARPGLLAAALLARAAGELHHGQGARQADRDQPQCHIRQEVVVRLQQDVQQLIQQNPQAFPQQKPPTMRKLASDCRPFLARRRLPPERRQSSAPERAGTWASGTTAILGRRTERRRCEARSRRSTSSDGASIASLRQAGRKLRKLGLRRAANCLGALRPARRTCSATAGGAGRARRRRFPVIAAKGRRSAITGLSAARSPGYRQDNVVVAFDIGPRRVGRSPNATSSKRPAVLSTGEIASSVNFGHWLNSAR